MSGGAAGKSQSAAFASPASTPPDHAGTTCSGILSITSECRLREVRSANRQGRAKPRRGHNDILVHLPQGPGRRRRTARYIVCQPLHLAWVCGGLTNSLSMALPSPPPEPASPVDGTVRSIERPGPTAPQPPAVLIGISRHAGWQGGVLVTGKSATQELPMISVEDARERVRVQAARA